MIPLLDERPTALAWGEVDRELVAGTHPGAAASIRRLVSWGSPERIACVVLRGGRDGAPSPDPVLLRGVEAALSSGLPIVGVFGDLDPSTDDLAAVAAWGRAQHALAQASGTVPVALVLDGAVTGIAAMALALADVVVATPRARAHVGSPGAVAALTGREVDDEWLGGPSVLARAGVVSHVATDLDDALAWVEECLGHLPPNSMSAPPALPSSDPPGRTCEALARIVPADARRGYDVRDVAAELADDGELIEVAAAFGPAIICAFARFGGVPVGVVANQPNQLAGAIDIPSSQKAARFISWCDAFGVPIVTLVDTPGYLPGRDLEWEGMIRHGGQLAFAYAGATCPRISVVLRKAFGGAYIVMDSKTMGSDACYAWPDAQLAVMGAPGAVEILHRRQLAAAGDEALDLRTRLEAEYAAEHLNPQEALSRGLLDQVIDPASTRAVLCGALASLRNKRPDLPARRHANGPL